jgi:hypothetical protein
MSKTTAKLAAKGLDSTGVTPELARRYHDNLGSVHMAIIEYQVTASTDTSDGDKAVQLNILTIEPAPDQDVTEHLRGLQRAMYSQRTPAQLDGQSTLDDVEPTTDQYLEQGEALIDA